MMFNFNVFNNQEKEDSRTQEDSELLLSSSSLSSTVQTQHNKKSYAIRTCHAFVFYLILPTFTLVLGIFIGRTIPTRPRSLTEQVSKYSPILDEVDITFSTKTFNGSLFKPNDFRGPAGPVVDAAWESLGVDYRAAIVPSRLAEKSDLLPSQVHLNPKYGDGYLANVEGLHHLHCLNLLRQSLYYNFEYYYSLKKGAFKNEDAILKAHVTHCLDILRQQLQCTVDIGMLGQIWWNPHAPAAFPDFNTRHQCRNFEAVRSWAERHQAPRDPPVDFLMPPRQGEVLEEIP